MSTFTRTRSSDWNKVYNNLYELGIPLASARATDWIASISKIDNSYDPSELWDQIFTPDAEVSSQTLLTCVLAGISEALTSLCGPIIQNHFPLTYWEVDGMLSHNPSTYLTRDGFLEFICLTINTTYVSIMDDWGLFDTGNIMLLQNMFNPIPLTNVLIRGQHPASDFPDTLQNILPTVWPHVPFGFFHIMTFYICAVYISRSSHPWGPKDGIKIVYDSEDESMTLITGLRRILTAIEFLKVNRSIAIRKIQNAERHRQYRSLMKTVWRVLNAKAITKGLLEQVKKYLTND